MGEHLQIIGYWPKPIFSTLIDHANVLRWGGIVYTSNGEKSPPMGSGHWPAEGYRKACFFDKVMFVDKENKYREIGKDDVIYYESPCYGIGYFKKMKVGRSFFFGGPGGC